MSHPCRPPACRVVAAVVAAALALTHSPGSRAATYHVDPVAGIDDIARDGLTPDAAWHTLTYAVRRIPAPGPHEVLLAPGEYSQSTGESFPLTLPSDLSLTGAGPDQTVFRDEGVSGVGTLRWTTRVLLPAGTPVLSGFSVIRRPSAGQPVGAGLELRATDVAASPRVTNVVLRGAARGLDLYSLSETTATSLVPAVDASFMVQNGIGVLSTAYTAGGQASAANPQLVNCVIQENLSDGIVFEASANWDLPTGPRGNATSSPIVTNCTISDNVGSALLLDNSNGYIRYRSGPINPRVTNSVLSGNGDYALHEYTTTTDPAQFDRNLIGGNVLALYRDEGTTDILTLAGMPLGTGNLDQAALFAGALGRDWHLRGDSPGVDAVTLAFPATDLEGDPRPADGNGDGTAAADMGADEAWPCAVDAVIDPALPPERCGLEAPLLLSAATSAPAAAFTCTAPLEFAWFADGVEFATTPEVSVVPPDSTTYTVIVRCPDYAFCQDAASVDVVVHSLPVADAEAGVSGTPTGEYEACVPWDAADVTVDLAGTAASTDPSARLDYTEWVSAGGVLLGSATLNPQLAVTNDGTNQDIPVSLTATDTNGCSFTSFTRVHVWRGPRPLPGGPYEACQDVDATQTTVPLAGDADVPAGSAPRAWLWRTDVGRFDDTGAATSALQVPGLVLTNFPFDRTVNLSLTVTDDKGCTDDASTTLVLRWTAKPEPNGPYQQPESPTSPTSFALSGTFTGPASTTLRWTTDLGTFQSSGTMTADGADQLLDVPNTGADQLGQLCLTAVPAAGACEVTRCTVVSVRVSPARPPNDIGGTFRIAKGNSTARLYWINPRIDATHDQADAFDAWESVVAGPGAWAQRPTVVDIPRRPGGTYVDDATLLDTAGPDLLFLKIVAENTGGASCPDPASDLPDCPSIEDCANGVDDDGDLLVDCEDPGCAGVPPCP